MRERKNAVRIVEEGGYGAETFLSAKLNTSIDYAHITQKFAKTSKTILQRPTIGPHDADKQRFFSRNSENKKKGHIWLVKLVTMRKRLVAQYAEALKK
jgi:hypothetical protein